MNRKEKMEKQKLLNTYVNNVDMSETLLAIDNMIESAEKTYAKYYENL